MEPAHLNSRAVVVVYGSNGLIGSELCRQLEQRGTKVIPASRDNPLSGVPSQGPVTLVFANGITDPGQPEGLIREANLESPRRIIEKTQTNPEARYVTLGSAMEHFEELCATNAYLRSKLELGRMIAAHHAGRAVHVRLHTVYGGNPKPHMFLGQIVESIREGHEFRMSHGQQLREFHHVEDVAAALVAILQPESGAFTQGVITLSSGEPVRLAELARAVFQACGCENLLQIGAIPAPTGENTDRVFPRTESRFMPRTRVAIAGVTAWVKGLS